ncbi:MAG TPA: TonB-dependent receptor [Sphingomonas sp.]|nr:TonB-dependent receptor [Sphingomonas sp.]
MAKMVSIRAAMLSSAMGVLTVAMPAWAQGTAPVAAQEESARREDEIVVTATRREERLQDVPLAVTAVSAEELARSNLKEVTDIQYLAPNITFSATNPVSNGGGYQIRGVGTQTYDSSVEQTVGLVVDSVVIGLSRDPGATGFADVERVEVLRGPQGTLFGKNSSAGVIQVITRRPQLGKWGMDLDLGYGERNDRVARATANLPLGDSAALRVSGFSNGQDGAIPNVVNGTRVGDRSNNGVRARMLWEPSSDLSFLLTGEYQTAFARDAQTIESLGTSAAYNAQFARFAVRPGHGVYLAYNDRDWTADSSLWGTSLQADYAMGDATLTSITAYRALKVTQLSDIDAAPVDIFNHSDGGVDSNQFTQELRLTSPSGKPLEYVAGLYYYRTENNGDIAQYGNFYGIYGRPVVIASGLRTQVNKVRSIAAFGQLTYRILPGVKLIGGLRYTNDENHGSVTITPLPFPAVIASTAQPYDGTVKADNVSGKVGIQFDASRDLMFYATYSTGYKGPAIDGTGGVVREVEPETVRSYELGAKSTLFEGALTLNASLYWADYNNFQTTALDMNVTPPSFILTNAGGLRARGAEVEAQLRVARGFRLSASGSYSDAVYREFLGPCYSGQANSSVPGTGCYLLPGSTTVRVSDYAGYSLPNAPKWSYTLRASYEQPIGDDLALDASANWAWRDATQAVLGDPKARIQAFGLLNGTIGLSGNDGQWRLSVYARNLLNQHFYAPYAATATFNPGGYNRIMSPEAFRTVGGALSFHF